MKRIFYHCFLGSILLIAFVSQPSANEPVPSLSSGCEVTINVELERYICNWYVKDFNEGLLQCQAMVANDFSDAITGDPTQYCSGSGAAREDGFVDVHAGWLHPTSRVSYFLKFWYPPIGYCENGTIDQLTGECSGFSLGIPDNPSLCGPLHGNPCNPATGAKFQTETDVPANNQGLGFSRYYNSQGQYRDSEPLGPNWRHQYGGRLVAPAQETAP